VYRGYDVITNKIPEDEREGVPHHLLGFVDETQEYTVQNYERDAIKKIEEIHNRGRWPILVGGTHYYLQSTLFIKNLIADDNGLKGPASDEGKYKGMTNEELHRRLEEVDPAMAQRWHPNNRRKILRSLEVFDSTGRPHSDWIRETDDARRSKELLKYPLCLFWLYSDFEVLDRRLAERARQMARASLGVMYNYAGTGDSCIGSWLRNGLFDDLRRFRRRQMQDSLTLAVPVYTKGICQAIGIDADEDPTANRMLEQGLEDMAASNRQYSRRQVSWLRNKLLPICNLTQGKDVKAHAYLLDATDLTKWDSQCRDQAVDIAKRFIRNEALPNPASLSDIARRVLDEIKPPRSTLDLNKYRCDVCSKSAGEAKDGKAREVILHGEEEYSKHLKSRQHRKNVQYKKM
ncbi:tRNA dimethylallyltransferase, mitochondrial, partial [Spiromyces aspiralis]